MRLAKLIALNDRVFYLNPAQIIEVTTTKEGATSVEWDFGDSADMILVKMTLDEAVAEINAAMKGED